MASGFSECSSRARPSQSAVHPAGGPQGQQLLGAVARDCDLPAVQMVGTLGKPVHLLQAWASECPQTYVK